MKTIAILPLVTLLSVAAPALAAQSASDPVAAEVVTLYQHMQSSLASDQPGKVAELAKMIASKTEPCECGSENKAAYAAVYEAAKAVQGSDLATLREQFKPLSRAIAGLATAAGVTGVQLFHCPMVKAYWLQPSTENTARNPYLGEAMPGCGMKVDKMES